MKPCSPAPNEISNIPVAAIPKPVYRIKLAGLGKNNLDEPPYYTSAGGSTNKLVEVLI